MSSASLRPPFIGSRWRWWRRLAGLTLLPYLFVTGMLGFLQRSLIYLPAKGAVPVTEAGYPPQQLREIKRVTEDGITLHGWFVRADGADWSADALPPDDQCWIMLYFPGNGGHRGYRLKEIRQMTSLGCHVVYFDYRGYAENGGTPSEEDIARDARGTWDFATRQLGAAPDRIVLWGESLGGGVATRLAADLSREGRPPAGLVLRGTFTSLVDAAAYHYPWLPVRWLLLDRYPSLVRIGSVTCPLLMIHGRLDRIVPFEQGQRLFAAAPAVSGNGVPKRFVELPHAGHNDMMYVAADEIHSALRDFLQSLPPPAAQSAAQNPPRE